MVSVSRWLSIRATGCGVYPSWSATRRIRPTVWVDRRSGLLTAKTRPSSTFRHAGDVGDAGADRPLLHTGLRSTAGPETRPANCRSPGEDRFSTGFRDLASRPDRLSTVQYDARPMLEQIRAMPGGIRLFLAYALLILAGIGLSLRSVVDTAISTPVSLEGVVVMILLAYTIFTTTLVLQRKQAARGLALGLASLTIPLVPLLALSRLLVEAVFVAALGLLLFRGLLRPEVRTYLNEP